ncbi:MAG: NUDIX domain-containing protein [Actinobacteria bacterium]|nr:NUDIX domain-containing protein [Actinomycetota bacterium]MSW36493.1 NUDIX domain-containing protein [Actinomycetota bacterium]
MPGNPRPAPPAGGRPIPRPPAARLGRVEETSAGGLILDLRGPVPRAALIARLDRRGRLMWSLPKGHVEAGETIEQAAVREVEEETGIAGSVIAPLGTIDFWFVAEHRRVHKTVHHFLLEALSEDLSDADAEVVEVGWVPLDAVADTLAYADERRLIGLVEGLLARSGDAPDTDAGP